MEAAIFALPDVVESATDLDGELCGDVAACLLRLEESFAISNFDQRRYLFARPQFVEHEPKFLKQKLLTPKFESSQFLILNPPADKFNDQAPISGSRHGALVALLCKDPRGVAARLSESVWNGTSEP